MLKKKYRLPRRDGGVVFKQGRTFGNAFFLTKVKNNHLFYSRLAFVVPSKIEKKPTKRNRLRRRVYEVLRHQYKLIREGLDILIIVQNPKIFKKTYPEIEKELKNTLQKAKLLRSRSFH